MKKSLYHFLTNNFNDVKFTITPSDCYFEFTAEWQINGETIKTSAKSPSKISEDEVIDIFNKLTQKVEIYQS